MKAMTALGVEASDGCAPSTVELTRRSKIFTENSKKLDSLAAFWVHLPSSDPG